MLGKESVLKSLAAQRQALVAESDLHRTEFAREWAVLTEEAAHIARPARTAGHFLSVGARAFGIFMTVRRIWTQAGCAGGRKNWVATLLQAARAGLSFWPAFRSATR